MTVPVLIVRWVPGGQLFGLGPDLYETFTIVVPIPPDQVVVLTCVARLVTDRPDTGVSESVLQPAIVAIRTTPARTSTGGGAANVEHSATGTAEADPVSGTKVKVTPAIASATRLGVQLLKALPPTSPRSENGRREHRHRGQKG